MSSNGSFTHYRACNLCEAICGLEIQVEDGEIVAIRGDRDDPFSRGHICPKAVALQDIYNDPDRLKKPLRRTPAGWQEIGWQEAFAEAADRLRQIQTRDGRDAVALYLGNPTVHNLGSMLLTPQLMKALGSRNIYSATSVDQLPHQFVAYLMFGHQLLVPIPDIDRTDYFLILGANPAVSNGSLMTAPDVKKRIKEIRDRGGKVVVIDPRRTETAKLADEHHFVRPGNDAFLLLSLLQTIFAEGLENPGRLAEHSDGLATVRRICQPYPAERVAGVVGIVAPEIRRLARELCAARSSVVYGRIGLSVQEHGSICQWLIVALNLVTGNLDRPGGAMFTLPAVDIVGGSRRPGSYARYCSRVRGLPEVGGELPVAALAEEMLTPGEGQIRGFVTSAGNPVLSTPNGRQLDRALASLDFMVSIDFYLNETTRHADLILPPTSALEHDHYDLVFHALAIRNTTRYSEPLFAPATDALHDWQILLELIKGIEGSQENARLDAFAKWGPAGVLDQRLRSGPYQKGSDRYPPGLDLATLQEAVHGIDLGPLVPLLPGRLFHDSGRIDLAPEPLVADIERLEQRLATPPSDALRLIGRRQVRSNNSWMHNYSRLMRGKDRCTLLIHPQDAASRGLTDQDLASVSSRVGQVVVPIEISDAIMPGIVSLPHGWGHDREGVELQEARRRPGASLNDLTDDERLDSLSGNAALNDLPVEVTAVHRTS